MRHVIYALDMEPITVVDLPEWSVEYMDTHRCLRLGVSSPPIQTLQNGGPVDWRELTYHVVNLTAVPLRMPNGSTRMLLLTSDDESALLLKCAFLPGQQAGLREREREAYARGVLAVLSSAIGRDRN